MYYNIIHMCISIFIISFINYYNQNNNNIITDNQNNDDIIINNSIFNTTIMYFQNII